MAANSSPPGMDTISPMHIYHVASGTPVVTILRPAKTPKGTAVRTVNKHVTRRVRQHWRTTRLIWRGDSHYGRLRLDRCRHYGDTPPSFPVATIAFVLICAFIFIRPWSKSRASALPLGLPSGAWKASAPNRAGRAST